MSTIDLVVLGDVNPDLVLTGDVTPRFGQAEHLVDDAVITIGGSGAITACAAARLGLRVSLCGVVGNDPLGRFLRESLEARGIDVRGLVTDPTVPTGITVVLSRPSDRASLTYAGAISRLSAELVDRDLLRASRHVHVSQFFMQDALRPGLPDLLDEAHSAGASTSIDPNWDPAERWDGDLLAQLARTDVFFPNAAEAMHIANRADAETAARELARSADLVVVKDGMEGSLAAERNQLVRAGPLPVESVDATGAGDAFDAGFLAAHLGGEPLERALVIGNACGALSTRALGGVDGLPTMDEVAALLETDALG